jgi:hypothetical protein
MDLGHHNASLNILFLMTGDLFQLKTGLNDTQLTDYLSLRPEERRSYLDDDLHALVSPNGLDLTEFDSPHFIDSLEGFATPNVIRLAFVGL